MFPGITFYKATLADIDILVKYRVDFALALSGEQSAEAIKELETSLKNYFTKATADKSCISFIAKCGSEVAGIGSMILREQAPNFKNKSGCWAYIMNMYTLPAHRRKGVCKGILNALVDEGKQLGVEAFELHATREGELVYKSNGFGIHNEPTYRKFIKKQLDRS